MIASKRKYKERDIEKISEFYGKIAKNNCESNNLKCAWECFSKHPCFIEFRPEEFGIWENNGEMVGVVMLESPWNGAVCIDLLPQYNEIYDEIIEYAEEHFIGVRRNGDRYLTTHVLTSNNGLQQALTMRGYEKGEIEYVDAYDLSQEIPRTLLPEGFAIKSLDEVYDFDKLNLLLWKGFGYEGEPPAYDAENVKLSIKHAWLEYKRDLCNVILAPDGTYASFCGIWFDDDNKEAYLEPLATAKEYRNLGLAKCCVYEALKKCEALGTKYVYVEPDDEPYEFYKKIGFTAKVREGRQWTKKFK